MPGENERVFESVLRAWKPKSRRQPVRVKPVVPPEQRKKNWPQKRSVICDCKRYNYKCVGCKQKYNRKWAQGRK